MRKVGILVKYNLKRIIVKSPISFILGIIVPVTIALVFTKGFTTTFKSSMNIGVIDRDKSISSEYVTAVLEENSAYKVILYDEYDEGLLQKGKVDVFLDLKNDFEKNLPAKDGIEVLSLEGNTASQSVIMFIQSEVDNLSLLRGSKGDISEYQSEVEKLYDSKLVINESIEKSKFGEYMGVQILVAQILFLMVIKGGTAAEVFFNDRKINIFTRLFTMPIKTIHYYLAALISNVLAILVQSYTTIILAKVILKIDFGVALWELFLLMFIFAIVVVAFTQLIITVCKTPQEVGSLNMNILMVWSLIGGAFVPVQIFPDILNKISFLSPIRWGVEFISKGQEGGNIMIQVLCLGILILFALVIFLSSVYISKRSEKVYA